MMDKEFSTFRKSAFGGFNRKDVINYIEKMKNESFEYKKQVEKTVDSLNEKIRELENAAKLMEENAALNQSAESEKEQTGEYFCEIGQATEHLKTVADELCKSLGEFMDKLSSRGLFEKPEDKVEACEIEAEKEAEVISFVDGILSSLSFLEDSVQVKKEVKNEVKNEGNVVSDILSGLSFLD